MVDDAMAQQRPILHQALHGHSLRTAFGPTMAGYEVISRTAKPEAADVMPGSAFGRQIGQDFADHRREFEAVAGTGRGDDDVRRAGQPVDEEIVVGRHRVEAGFRRRERTIRRRDVVGERGADQRLVGGGHRAVEALGIDGLVAHGDAWRP